jgi:uncharacterized protein YxeA
MQKITFTAVFALLFIALSSFTTTSRWRYIGDKTVAMRYDRDVLYVTGNDVFTRLQVKVTGAPLTMYDMDVYYENGDKQNVVLQCNFSQGESSRVIDLAGNKRRIKKIEFKYDTKNVGHGHARVAVWGKR